MKMIHAYVVGNEWFRTSQEASAMEREIALMELMDGNLDTLWFIKKFCRDEEFRKRLQEISDMGVVED